MSSRQPDEERIFHVARGLADEGLRSEYLDQICAGDQALRERVESLLEVHEREQSFLKSQPAACVTADYKPVTERPGQEIGRYKLLQEIGEGGFGVVYMAEQRSPVRRKVALKVIKPGMDTREVIARFEAERQALGLMKHSNIAVVYDGGTTESGRPYFVMEYVNGIPITEYCDQNQVPARERLELFISVCHAVQHAHQKGIIHRDLKPSNVLVTLADGKPVVKVIDFGVAKAINQRLTEKTLFTAHGQMVGTPQYMSPEAAEMTCLDIDTRSDVYSLGVLLYELLTGSTPLESEKLREAGYAEIQRLIKETEAPKPSTRLSTSGERLTAIAKHRSVSPDRLSALVRGDLDLVVMKTLEKDRTRRYESPKDLAQDVGNYLAGEPVKARPPTMRYLATKYLRRNRVPIAVCAMLILSLSLGLIETVWLARVARRQAEAARDALAGERAALGREKQARIAANEATESALASLQRAAHEVYDRSLNQAANGGLDVKLWSDEAPQLRIADDRIKFILGLNELGRGNLDQAQTHFKAALDHNPGNISVTAASVSLAADRGNYEEWLQGAYSVDLEKAIPKNPEDYLFLALAKMIVISPRDAVRLAETAVDRRPSPFAISVRAKALTWLSLMSGEPKHANRANREIEALHELYPTSPFSLNTELFVKTALIIFAADDGQRAAYEADGSDVAESLLDKHPNYGPGRFQRAIFLDLVRTTPEASREWSEVRKITGVSSWSLNEVYLKYRMGSINTAADLAKELPKPSAYAARPLFFDKPVRRATAEAYAEHVFQEQLDQRRTDETRLRPLLFAGGLERAMQMAQEWLENTEHTAFWQKWDRAKLKYYLNGDAHALLASAGESPLLQCDAHSLIGARLLCKGDRSGAQDKFREAVATQLVWWPYYQVSVIYLERMRDKRWPDWLPLNATQEL